MAIGLNRMRVLKHLLLISGFLISSCSQRLSHEKINGEWKGFYKNTQIRLIFNDNEVLRVVYVNENRSISTHYLWDADMLVLKDLSDTATVQQLTNNRLVLKPVNAFKKDLNLIYLIDFEKVEK